jgi:hypothetical protein
MDRSILMQVYGIVSPLVWFMTQSSPQLCSLLAVIRLKDYCAEQQMSLDDRANMHNNYNVVHVLLLQGTWGTGQVT